MLGVAKCVDVCVCVCFRCLSDVSVVVLDEVHERSTEVDLLLLLLSRALIQNPKVTNASLSLCLARASNNRLRNSGLCASLPPPGESRSLQLALLLSLVSSSGVLQEPS